MTQKIIHLGEYQFLLEIYKSGIDFDRLNNYNRYVILRNFEIYNDILYDKDIYFIEQNLYEKIKSKTTTQDIVFPIYNKKIITFSDSPEKFNNYHFENTEDMKYKLNKKIPYDKVRIHWPTIKKDLDFIIYLDNYLNNVHFHYFCNLASNYERKFEKEIKIGNNRYIEYIEFYIPNIEFLFDEKNNVHFIEDFNNIESTDNIENYFNDKNE